MSREIMNGIFKLGDNKYYHLRDSSQFLVTPIQSVFNSSTSALNLEPKLCEQTLSGIKKTNFLDGFKK